MTTLRYTSGAFVPFIGFKPVTTISFQDRCFLSICY
jgi:hypothetical protein